MPRNNPSWAQGVPHAFLTTRTSNDTHSTLKSIANYVSLNVGGFTRPFFAMPVCLPAGSTFDQVGLHTNNIVDMRLGLYADDKTHGGPGRLLYDWGTVTGGIDATKTISISLAIHETDIYWLAILINDDTTSLLAYRSNGSICDIACDGTALAAFEGPGGVVYRDGVTASTLPDPYDDGGTGIRTKGLEDGFDHFPMICLRVDNPGEKFVQPKDISHITVGGMAGLGKSSQGRDSQFIGTTTNENFVTDQMFMQPFTIHRRQWIEVLLVKRTAGTGTTGYFGIYATKENGDPGELVWVSGVIDIDTTVSVDFQDYLDVGRYWVAFRVEAAGGTPAKFQQHHQPSNNFFSLTIRNYPAVAFYVSDIVTPMSDPFDLSLTENEAIDSASGGWGPISIGSLTSEYKDEEIHPHEKNQTMIPYHYFRKGWYIGTTASQMDNPAAKVGTAGLRLEMAPYIVNRPIYLEEISVSVSSNDSTSDPHYILLLDTHPDTADPGHVLYASDQIGTGGTGIKTAVLDPPRYLETGLYYLGFYRDSSNGTISYSGHAHGGDSGEAFGYSPSSQVKLGRQIILSWPIPATLPRGPSVGDYAIGFTTKIQGLG